MGLLDTDVRKMVGNALVGVFPPAVLHKVEKTSNDQGGFTYEETDYDCVAIREEYSNYFKQQNGIPVTDSKLIFLQTKMTVEPKKDDRATLNGVKFQIVKVEEDPARATWICQGRKVQ